MGRVQAFAMHSGGSVMIRKRLLALISIGAVVGALAIGVTHASSTRQSLPTGGLTFASTPTSAAILSSSVVTAAGGGTSGGSVAMNETATLTKWPKGHGPGSVHATGGVNGGSSASGPGHSTPATSSS